ncbi:hypothetical protein ACHAW5_001550 [Stephanodiscus triporus]|uniref:Flavin reductase like domain-containing protein n=1 Tax=Stephanodiscus triporus TaxID=2934178 RepID=A0ABD3NHT2_9STRA
MMVALCGCLLLLLTPSSRLIIAAAFVISPIDGGRPSPHLPPRGIRSGRRRSATEADDGDDDDDVRLPREDELFLERFRRRRDAVASAIDAERSRRPPSCDLADPRDVVASVLDGLIRPHEPAPYFGYEVLYATSTSRWREVLRKSVGASRAVEDGLIYRALGASIERPGNQFGILVRSGMEDANANRDDDDRDDASGSSSYADGRYAVEFPHDTLDYYDGSAWLECRLRDEQSDALLVVLGWSMKRREGDGAWLIDGIDWQDFRDDYRPGIGREEWERICG